MSYNELRNTLWANGTGRTENLCGVDSFWHAMAHTKACHGTHQGPGAKLGFEAWDTFQISYNELINTLWANGTGKKKICVASTCFGMPWHTPRHAMAPTTAPERTLDLKLGIPSKCLILNLEAHFGQMARAKQKFVRRRLVLACHGSHRGMPWHPPRHVMPPTRAGHGTPQGMPKHPPRQPMAPTKTWVCVQTCRAGPLTSVCSATNLRLQGN
jgi:hypothetical protein